MRSLSCFAILSFAVFTIACGGTQVTPSGQTQTDFQPDLPDSSEAAFPTGLPGDFIQPWEDLTAAGFIESSGNTTVDTGDRSGSSLNAASEFLYGDQAALQGGVALADMDALFLDGSGQTSYGIYRIPLGGDQPGAVACDVNLLDRDGGGLSEYYIGLADYGNGSWDWRGPFSDGHVRIDPIHTARSGADFRSPLGSVFVAVTTSGGNKGKVIGIGVNPVDPGDSSPPPQVTGLSIQPRNGALELNWNSVLAADLAGYRVYYKDTNFIDAASLGVRFKDYLLGNTTAMLTEDEGTWFVRVSAVDISGNEGSASDIVSAEVLPGSPPEMVVEISQVSAKLNDPVQATATGADTYDWDIDGDGVFDFVGDVSGIKDVYTGAGGIIRPLVRGSSDGGMAVTLGAVSLIIASNSRPVASANVFPASGFAPLNVHFDGTVSEDFDGVIVGGGWDFNGDGLYDVWEDADTVHINGADNAYGTPGTYNAKLRVVDDQGTWDEDTVAISVNSPSAPVANLESNTDSPYLGINQPVEVEFDASASYDHDGGTLNFEFDPYGTGNWVATGTSPDYSYSYSVAGNHQAHVRVTNGSGLKATTSTTVLVYRFAPVAISAPDALRLYPSVGIINGLPAVSYWAWDDLLHHTVADDPAGTSWTWTTSFSTSATSSTIHEVAMTSNLQNETLIYCFDHDSLTMRRIWINDYKNASGTSTVYSGTLKGQSIDAELIETHPAFVIQDPVTDTLIYRRSSDNAGNAYYSERIIVPSDVSESFDLAIVDGRPAVAFQYQTSGDIGYVIAQDTNGTNWHAPVTIDDGGGDSMGIHLALTEVNGNPAVVYLNSTQGHVRYTRATTTDGNDAADWPAPLELTDPDLFLGLFGLSLEVIADRPMIATNRSDGGSTVNLMLFIADDQDGASWNDGLLLENVLFTGQYPRIMDLNGQPAIFYYGAGGFLMMTTPRL